jgi:uncharacterized RDD family membrane protein YckC
MDVGAGPLEPAGSGVAATPGQSALSAEAATSAQVVRAAEAEIAAHAQVRYVGLATRVIAFVIDAALIDLVALIGGLGASLILALLHIPGPLKTVLAVIGGVVYIAWCVGYFVVFWSTTGQTPGMRVMQIRVVTTFGERLKPRRALVRCLGVLLAALPLFAGFVLILFDDRRRGFQDRFAGTLMIEASQLSIAEARRATKRAAYNESRRRPSG